MQALAGRGAGTTPPRHPNPLGRVSAGWQHGGMSGRRVRALAWGSFGLTVALCLGSVVFIALARSVSMLPNEFGFKG
jgi:hypothetical protein